MTSTFPRSALGMAATAALATLAACGGHDDSQGPGTDYSFKARSAAFAAAPASAASSGALSAAERSEVQQRSREWAVASLFRSSASSNGVTTPPLYFSLAFALEAAASGSTLEELHTVFQPVSSAAVRAELQRGLQRTVTAGERTVLGTGFFGAMTLADRPGTLTSLRLSALSATEQAASPLLRVAVLDQVAGQWTLPQAQTYNATWETPTGQPVSMDMVRFRGATRALSGAGWTAHALDLGGGQWMLKLEPTGSLPSWTSNDLNTAFEEAVRALDQGGTSADTTWELPQAAAASTTELADRRGMTLAQDEVMANFRNLDGGGTHLKFVQQPGASMMLGSRLDHAGAQAFSFEYSPRNVNGPGGGSYSSGATNVNLGSFTTCPPATVQPRPFFLAVLQASGNIQMFARLVQFSGQACLRVLSVPPPG